MIKCNYLTKMLMAALISAFTACSNDDGNILEDDGALNEEKAGKITLRIHGPSHDAITIPDMVARAAEIQTDEEKGIFSLQALIFKLNEGGDTSTNTDWTFAKSYYFDAGQDWGIDKTLNFTDYQQITLDDESHINKAGNGDCEAVLVIPDELHGKKIKVLLIANSKEEKSLTENSNYDDMLKETATSEGGKGMTALHKDKYFLMTAIADCNGDSAPVMSHWGIEMSASLIRLVARIDVENNTPGMTITSMTLRNSASKSYLIARQQLDVPENASMLKYEAINTPAYSEEEAARTKTAFYAFESYADVKSHYNSGVTQGKDDVISVDVKYELRYEGQEYVSKGEINIPFVDETGKFVDLKRNHRYKIVFGDGTPIVNGKLSATFVTAEWGVNSNVESEFDPDDDQRIDPDDKTQSN